MKRLASLLSGAVLAALLLLSLFASVASADPGDLGDQGVSVDVQGQDVGGDSPVLDILPEDPGFE
jgi:hypothetical protein